VYVVLPPTWLNMDNTTFKCTVTKFTVDLEQVGLSPVAPVPLMHTGNPLRLCRA